MMESKIPQLKLPIPPKPTFTNYGGYYHLKIAQVEDLEHLLNLEDGRWMATSCPLFGLNADPAFLSFLDADGNGRIISDEVRAAVRWLRDRLRPAEIWTERRSRLTLDLINTEHADGRALEKTARRVLDNLKLSDAKEISLEQLRDRQKIMAQADYNGDGVIPPQVVHDPETAQFVSDLTAKLGGVSDASGLKGVNEAILDQFKKEASAYLQWRAQGTIPEGQQAAPVTPFGAMTPSMFQSIAAIREKVDQFFAQCALVRFDPRMAERMRLRDDELNQFDYKSRETIIERLRIAPLAAPNPEARLPLDEGVNECYRGQIDALKNQVVARLFGEETQTLNESQWREILTRFAPYEAWLKAKPDTAVESLGVDKLRTYLDASYDKTVRVLIAADKAVSAEIQQLHDLEKLTLYHQWLFEFVNNYVNFSRLFDAAQRAMFEMGTLVLAGERFSFSVKVDNRNNHANLGKNSGIYLLYLQITGPKPEDNFEIAVPVTSGNSQGFYVGRRGVFFTITGRELDAQITQIVENPISFWELIKEPFRRFGAVITTRLDQLTATIQKEAETSIGKAGTSIETQIQTGIREAPQAAQRPATLTTPSAATPAAPPEPVRTEPARHSGTVRDLMIGTGFLIAGLGTALKLLSDAARQLSNPQTLQTLLMIIGVFVGLITLITAINAWRKVRRRDLGVLLQASGWAINGRVRLTRPLTRFFCYKARLPKGAKKQRPPWAHSSNVVGDPIWRRQAMLQPFIAQEGPAPAKNR
jgi:hypothetical protein